MLFQFESNNEDEKNKSEIQICSGCQKQSELLSEFETLCEDCNFVQEEEFATYAFAPMFAPLSFISWLVEQLWS